MDKNCNTYKLNISLIRKATLALRQLHARPSGVAFLVNEIKM